MAHKIPVKTIVDPSDASREELDAIFGQALDLHTKGQDYAADRLFYEAQDMEAILVAQY